MTVHRRILSMALKAAVFASLAAAQVVLAAETDASLDKMWTDPAVSDKKAGTASPSKAASAPLCSIDSLKQSELMKSGGWPGIGPFKPEGDEYVDAGQNRLKLES